MKKLVVLLAFAVAAPAAAQVYVPGHVTSDGTYVQGHHRTAPNDTKTDNWSSKPNVNPYTGQAGTRDPYATPSYPRATPYNPYKAPCYYNCKK